MTFDRLRNRVWNWTFAGPEDATEGIFNCDRKVVRSRLSNWVWIQFHLDRIQVSGVVSEKVNHDG